MAGEPIAVAFVEVRPEVQDFRADAQSEIEQATAGAPVDIKGEFSLGGVDQARQEVSALAEETAKAIDELAAATSQDFASGFTRGAQEAIASALELRDATGEINQQVITADAARRAFAQGNLVAAESERILEGATRAQTRAQIEAEAAESSLFRTRARRAQSVGPFRFAGVGLVAGTALFAATRALGELGDALTVTGEEAATFSGKMRNLGASLLSGDLVGAVRALTVNTKDFTEAELVAIAQTPRLSEALRELGQSANIARSTTEVLAGLADVPQRLQTALAFEQSQGDVQGQVRVLQEQLVAMQRQEEIARQIAQTSEQRDLILEPIFEAQTRIQDELRRLQDTGPSVSARASRASGADLTSNLEAELRDLERERDRLAATLPQGETAGRDLERLRTQLTGVNSRIEVEQRKIIEEQERHAEEVRGPQSAIREARLNLLIDTTELDSLQAEKRKLQDAIRRKQVFVDDVRAAADALAEVNRAIEALQDEIVAENIRHAEELRAGRLQETRIAVLEAETSGGDVVAALEAERDEILRQLRNKNISRDERERLLGELKSINAAIESLADQAAAEAERHADEIQRKQDAADQAFLDSIAGREGRARNRQIIAEATAQLADDIRVSEQLQRIFRESIAAARRTIEDARLRAETIARLREELLREQQNEKDLRRQQRQAAIAQREESINLDIQIAQANENEQAELRARRARVRFLQERIRATREGTNQRKRLILELRQEQAAIRDLLDQEKQKTGASFKELAFSFLQEQAGFVSNLASNFQPSGGFLPPVTTTTARRPITSPFEPRTTSAAGEAVAELRDSRGAPVSQSQGSDIIAELQKTNRLLLRIAVGVGHSEADQQRRLQRGGGSAAVRAE